MEGSLALDGIATSAPYNYSALDPKSMEERGVEQFRRKPKFQYVRFMIVLGTAMKSYVWESRLSSRLSYPTLFHRLRVEGGISIGSISGDAI